MTEEGSKSKTASAMPAAAVSSPLQRAANAIQNSPASPCSRIIFQQKTSPNIRKPRRPCSCRSRFDVSAQKLLFRSPRRIPLRVYFRLHRSSGLEGTGPEILSRMRVRQCIVIQSRAARSASASSALVILRARSARSEAALSDPRIAAMLSHLWAATRSTLHPRPVA